jgi:hypothetical protein
MTRSFISLDTIRIATPCHASWQEMEGDERVRFCSACRRNVYNLSSMTRSEAEDLVRQSEGRTCVRFYQREDGTMLTRDCPVGLRAWRRKLILGCTAAAALVVALFAGGIALLFSSDRSGRAGGQAPAGFWQRLWAPFFPEPPVVMGKMCPPNVNPGIQLELPAEVQAK